MTTLNARANQAWNEVTEEMSQQGDWFRDEQEAFEAGWEKGFQTATGDMLSNLRALRAEAITSERKNAYDRAIEAVEGLS